MARYIKVNPKVAEYLHLTNDRNKVTDGNYLLWQADMLAFGRLSELPEILMKIGGLSLQAHEAREEQDGTVTRELPTPEDPQFVMSNTDDEAMKDADAEEEDADDATDPIDEADPSEDSVSENNTIE